MFANMKNYQNYKLQVHFCIFTSLHMLNLHVFILATYPWPSLQVYTFASLQVYKFSSLQNKNIYKLHINNYNFTISQIANACLQVWKIAKLPNHQITNYKIYNYKIINCKIASS
jgi:hypothetical protein